MLRTPKRGASPRAKPLSDQARLCSIRSWLAGMDAARRVAVLAKLRKITDDAECGGENVAPSASQNQASFIAAAPLAPQPKPSVAAVIAAVPVITTAVAVAVAATTTLPPPPPVVAIPATTSTTLPPAPPAAASPATTSFVRTSTIPLNAAKARFMRRGPGAMLMNFANSPVAHRGGRTAPFASSSVLRVGLSPAAKGAAAAAGKRRKRKAAAAAAMAKRSAARVAAAASKRKRRRSSTHSAVAACALMLRETAAEFPPLAPLQPAVEDAAARVATVTASAIAAVACDDINHQTKETWKARQSALDELAGEFLFFILEYD